MKLGLIVCFLLFNLKLDYVRFCLNYFALEVSMWYFGGLGAMNLF